MFLVVSDSKLEKIVSARMRLMERHKAKVETTPAMSDEAPLGSGPQNRHGMPQVPPGQTIAKSNWPVLDLGLKPEIPKEEWRLEVGGACDAPITLDFQQLMELPQVTDTSDFHCVTTWSKLDMEWQGVRLADVLALAEIQESGSHLFCSAYDGYTTNIPIEEALKPDVLLAYAVDGEPLPREHGGPVRMITPQLYAWKGSKWIRKIEILTEDKLGFWEQRGYSNTAHPWRDDRYS